jgi:4-aminobutyrate aminotransferase-like enzyme
MDESGSSSPALDSSVSLSTMDQISARVSSRGRRPRRGQENHRSPLLKRSARGSSLFLEGAEGNWLSVVDGNRAWKIFDASGGAAVSNIGHRDERVHEAVRKQEVTGVGYAASMSFHTQIVEDFADFLLESTDDELTEVVFYGSGKMARISRAQNKLTAIRFRS